MPQRQTSARREERRIAENKLVTCPNCEKSFREQEINNHLDTECLNKELIPCEFCDSAVPMSDYSEHVESCPARSQSQQESRDRSPGRGIAEASSREEQGSQADERDQSQESSPNDERDRSPERGASQQAGGIRGFLRNLASSAANQIRSLNEPSQPQPQPSQPSSLFSQLLGSYEQSRQQQRPQNPFMPMQRPQQSGLFMQGQNQGFGGGNGRVVRTIQRGPGGSVIIRTSVVPSNQMPGPHGLENMGPLGLLLSMMNGMESGVMMGGGEQAPEAEGLSKQDIDSLALVKYSAEKNKNVDPESKKCPICLDEFEEGQNVRFLWCMHRFHQNCVDTWLDKHTNCPICKKDFSEANQEPSS